MNKKIITGAIALSMGMSSLTLAQGTNQEVTLNRDSIWNILTLNGDELRNIKVTITADWETTSEQLPNNLYGACVYHIITTSNGNPSEKSTQLISVNEEKYYVNTDNLAVRWKDCKDKMETLETSWDVENNKPEREL